MSNDILPGHIDLTGVDLRALIRAAYDASVPRGLGQLHFHPGSLDDEDLEAIMKRAGDATTAINLDYVRGRAVKLWIRKLDNGGYSARLDWFDHGKEAMKDLVRGLGLPDVEERIARAEATNDAIL